MGVFENRSADSTDVLHEYFVPPHNLEVFVEQIRPVILEERGDLLNVTVRDVRRDDDTFLRYADSDLLALVMLFHHPRTAEGDARMQSLTRRLIDAALRCGGRYYLPYRLHATDEQFRAAYPQADRFFELKRRYDPDEVFQNTVLPPLRAVATVKELRPDRVTFLPVPERVQHRGGMIAGHAPRAPREPDVPAHATVGGTGVQR